MMLEERAVCAFSPRGRPRSDEKALKSDRMRCTLSYPNAIHTPEVGSRRTGEVKRMASYQGKGF